MKDGDYKVRRPLENHKVVMKKMSENVGNQGGGSKLAGAMKGAGYSESYIRSGHIKNTKSWQNLVEDVLPDEMLLKTHRALLQHKEWRARDAGLEKAYKLKKHYKEEITVKNEFADFTDVELEQQMAHIITEIVKGIAKDDRIMAELNKG